MILSDNGGCAEFLKEDTKDPTPHRYNQPTLDGKSMKVGNNPQLNPGPSDTFMSYDIPWANVSNTPFRLYKSWVHEGGISTPFIISWPKRIKEPGLRHCSIHIQDIMPTCIHSIAASYPKEFNGHNLTQLAGESFLDSINNSNWSREKPIWFEHEGNRTLRDGPWKLV